jgi:hypothetical protein
MKVTTMKVRLLLPAIMLALLIAACAPPANLRDENLLKDTSLVTDQPCASPCWHGIIPGETSWRDMLILIEDDAAFANVEDLKDEETEARVVNFGGADGNGTPCCRIYSSEDGKTVEVILAQFAPSQITLSQILEKYGEPAYVIGSDAAPDQALISLVYPDVPLIIYVFAAGIANGELTPDSDILATLYVTQTVMDDITTTNNFYAWEGYRKLAGWLDKEEFDFEAQSTAEAETTAEAESE